MKRLFAIADNRRPNSLVSRFRRKRFRLFSSLLAELPRPVRILDVGGTPEYWRNMGAWGNAELEITILNLIEADTQSNNVRCIVGDARDLSRFSPHDFDVVFSNSVIEHLGSEEDQERMAREIRRVGPRFFVQTPNRYFPIEPHFFFPGFQFLPLALRIALVRRFALGYHAAIPDPDEARRAVVEIRLLSAKEVSNLFPEATVFRERVLGLTKSFIAFGGWSA